MSIDVKNFANIPYYQGEHAIPKIRFRPARAALGVSAWGMNVLELEPGCDGCPEHDHVADGQEEVYVVLEGSVILRAQGQERVLERGDFAKVPPDVTRKLITREHGAVVLALGGTPGQAYAIDPRLAT